MSRRDELAYHQEAVNNAKAQIAKAEAELERIYDDLLEELIDRNTYTKKRLQLIERKRQSALRLERHNETNDSYKEQGSLILELVKNAYPCYKASLYA